MDLQCCFSEWQPLVGAPMAGDRGNKANLWSLDLRLGPVQYITFPIISPSLLPSLSPHLHSVNAPPPCSYLCPIEPAALTSPSRAAIVILGTWEIKSLLVSDGIPAHWNELPFVMIQTCRVPSYGPQGCFCTACLVRAAILQHKRPCNYLFF